MSFFCPPCPGLRLLTLNEHLPGARPRSGPEGGRPLDRVGLGVPSRVTELQGGCFTGRQGGNLVRLGRSPGAASGPGEGGRGRPSGGSDRETGRGRGFSHIVEADLRPA